MNQVERLASLIRARVPDPAKAAQIMEHVLPYFAIVESNKLTILQEAQLDRVKIAEALAHATRLPVDRATFFHLDRPFEKPDWMTDAVYERDRTSNVWDDLLWSTSMEKDESGLARSLRGAHEETSKQKIDSAGWHEIRCMVGDLLGDPLKKILTEHLRDVHTHYMFRGYETRIAYGIQSALFYYLVFATTRDEARANWFVPLLEQMCVTLPFGVKNKKDNTDPTVWITLCMA